MKIFVLEDCPVRLVWFKKKFPNIEIVDNVEDAIETLRTKEFDLIFLDHDLKEYHYEQYENMFDEEGADIGYEQYLKDCEDFMDAETGIAVARFLANNPDNNEFAGIVIHTQNDVGQYRMKRILTDREPQLIPFPILIHAEIKEN